MISVPTEEVAGGWRRLHADEFHICDQIREDEMGGSCSTNGEMGNYTVFWSESLMGRGHSEDLSIVRRIILEWMLKKEVGWEGLDWTHLAQDRYQWRTLVDTLMNVRLP
jgi:hypothetical protein